VRVLLTGAFGNIGRETLRELLRAGHEVRAFDLATPRSRRVAAGFEGLAEIRWGDVTRPEDVDAAVSGCEGVIHDAAIIPPRSESDPVLARRVNVDGTQNVLTACAAQGNRPRLVFASSIALFGLTQDQPPPRRADDPVVPTDHYSRSKAECEEKLRASGLDWVIVRFAAAPGDDPDPEAMRDLSGLFRIDPATRVEYLHPADAGLAQVRALECDEARQRVLLIGGGPGCQITMGQLNDAFLDALGVGPFPASAYGEQALYTDWIDTTESQRLLGYQRHRFEDSSPTRRRRMRRVRPFVRMVRGPIRWWLLRHSPTRGRSRS
jgi:nucleoside-diphosphate-sugar epimerase